MSEREMARLAAQLVEAGMDPASADGRAGLGALLREFERSEPGAVRRLGREARSRSADGRGAGC